MECAIFEYRSINIIYLENLYNQNNKCSHIKSKEFASIIRNIVLSNEQEIEFEG